MSATADYKITRAVDGDVISGKIVAALASKPAGTLVRTKSPGTSALGAHDDLTELQLCDGKGPVALLERDILADGAEIPLADFILPTKILTPVQVGNYGSARIAEELEVEGSDLILTSTGQALSGSTPIDSELTSKGGKWALRTDRETQELCGWLRGVVAPVTSGGFRLLIQVANGGLQTPAA